MLLVLGVLAEHHEGIVTLSDLGRYHAAGPTGRASLQAIAGPLLGFDQAVSVGGGRGITRVGPVAVVAVAGVVGRAGWALLAILERLTIRARTAWTTTALAALVASLVGLLAATAAAATTALAALHLTVAAVLIARLRHTASRRPVDGGHRS